METRCDCPRSLNIFLAIFLLAIATTAIFNIWDTYLPAWTTILSLIFGLMSIILNSISRVRQKGEYLSIEQANKLHSRDGY